MVSKPNQLGLFSKPISVLNLPNAQVSYYPGFVSPECATHWFKQLCEQTKWRQEELTLFGKQVLAPRLSCWVADSGLDYSYSNMTMQATPWTPLLLEIKAMVEHLTGKPFNSVLLNNYRDGRDSNGWHADDEPELGNNPWIASLSFGATRDFLMREKAQPENKVKLPLESGSLLVMKGATQHYWQHNIPKRASAGQRLNLTFRTIVSTQ